MSVRTLVQLTAGIGVFGALALSQPRVAHAGGLEYTGQGAQSLGRGGAVAANATDPMVLAHNPAGLAELRGNQMLINFNIALMNACVDPAGYYGWGAYLGGRVSQFPDPETGENQVIPLSVVDYGATPPIALADDYYRDPYDTVCLDQVITPVPQLAFSLRLSDKVGIGFGLITPAVQPSGSWGARGTGVIRNETGDLRPAATRYQLLTSNNIGLFPNFGIGYRLADWLRIGTSLEYGFITVDNRTMAPATGGTSPNNDIVTHIRATDYFVPAFTASVHMVPVDSIDIVAAFRWQDDIDAAGTAGLTSGIFDPAFLPNRTAIEVLSVQQKMPWKLRGGIRYSNRRAPRATGTGPDLSADGLPIVRDPLTDERFDIELDVEYQFNSRNQAQFVDFVDGSRVQFKPSNPNQNMSDGALPNDITIQKQWQDQVSIRLGGTANVVPGILGISAGAHYETRGVTPAYMQVDFWPVARLGLHTGVTLRVARSVDFVFSYAHIFQETIIVAPPAHRLRGEIYDEYIATGGPNGGIVRGNDKIVGALLDNFGGGLEQLEEVPQGTPDGVAALQQTATTTASSQPPYITNAGRYRSSIDVVSFGLNFHF